MLRNVYVCAAVLFLALQSVVGDINLHSPRGSNNKLNEQTNNVQNDHRLFDSQNNANSGYQVGDDCVPSCNFNGNNNAGQNYDASREGAGKGTMKYHANSLLQIEWTVQHGCGARNDVNNCDMVLQYMCDDTAPGLRDGSNRDTIGGNSNAERQNPNTDKFGLQYGQHETYAYYHACQSRERNKNLFTADQLTSKTRKQTAAYTRQNNGNGNNINRYGFECPEERDYYPYWHWTPWRDIAVFTDDTSRCGMYRWESQNWMHKNHCEIQWKDSTGKVPNKNHKGQNTQAYNCSAVPSCRNQRFNEQNQVAQGYHKRPRPNNKKDCDNWYIENPDQIGVWKEDAPHDEFPPTCSATQYSRINHLGNANNKEAMAGYVWRIPDIKELYNRTCIFRIRYNISSGDVPWDADASMNGAIAGNPIKDFIGGGLNTGPLRMNINTAQFPRTFEERTHVFKILPPNRTFFGEVYNFNVRGRRGNIVQTYPSVEYDFVVPKPVDGSGSYNLGDRFHIQWTGSDANNNGNAGNGRQGTDRSNMVQIKSKKVNVAKSLITGGWERDQFDLWESMFTNKYDVERMAMLNQGRVNTTDCSQDDQVQKNQANHINNCARLNYASAYFDAGLVPLRRLGEFHIMSTRNNAFTNRGQKMTFSTKINLVEAVAIAVMGIAGAALMSAGIPFLIGCCYGHDAAHKAASYSIITCFGLLRPRKTDFDILKEVEEEKLLKKEKKKGEHDDDIDEDELEEHIKKTRCCNATRKRWEVWYHFESQRINAIVIFTIINIGFAIYGAVKNWDRSPAPYFPYAKAGGAMLNVNCCLIFIPVCRKFMSWLRSTPLIEILPLDDAIMFHKIFAMGILIAATLHITCHYANFIWFYENQNLDIFQQAMGTLAGFTGHVILLCMFLMFCTALECVRRKRWTNPVALIRSCFGSNKKKLGKFDKTLGGYNIFYNIHQLYLVCIVALLLHGPVFWLYAAWPLILMYIEHIIHVRMGKRQLHVVESRSLPGNVLMIKFRMADGKKFRYQSGQYLYLNCPQLSAGWHPFTISSASEDPYTTVHIRCGGDWTSKLKKLMNPNDEKVVTYVEEDLVAKIKREVEEEHKAKAEIENPVADAEVAPKKEEDAPEKKKDETKVEVKSAPMIQPELHIDGPFGAASEDFFKYKTVILVGAGIGVTPFASIMRSIAIKERAKKADRARRGKEGKRERGNTTWMETVNDAGEKYFYTHNSSETKNGQKTSWTLPESARIAEEEKCTKVHFFWLCRNKTDFDSFKFLLEDDIRSESDLAKNFKTTLYISGELELTNSKILEEMKKYEEWCEVRTGRPKWNRIFKEVAGEVRDNFSFVPHGGHRDVGVFLCGPPAIGKALRKMCDKYSPQTRVEALTNTDSVPFHYHTEHF